MGKSAESRMSFPQHHLWILSDVSEHYKVCVPRRRFPSKTQRLFVKELRRRVEKAGFKQFFSRRYFCEILRERCCFHGLACSIGSSLHPLDSIMACDDSDWIRYVLEGEGEDQGGSDQDTSPFSAPLGGLLSDDADFMIDPRNNAPSTDPLVVIQEGMSNHSSHDVLMHVWSNLEQV